MSLKLILEALPVLVGLLAGVDLDVLEAAGRRGGGKEERGAKDKQVGGEGEGEELDIALVGGVDGDPDGCS